MLRSLHIADLNQGSFGKVSYRPVAPWRAVYESGKAAINNVRKDTGILMQKKLEMMCNCLCWGFLYLFSYSLFAQI